MQWKGRIRRLALKDDDVSWHTHRDAVRRVEQWMREIELRGDPPPVSNSDTTAIILNYKRPQNLDVIVRSLLWTPSVQTVTVSNNNPAIDARRWITVRNDRLHFIDQPARRSTAERYRIAPACDTDFFIAVDDDLFLRPDQYEQVIRGLKADPSRVHGMFGQLMQQDGHLRHAVTGDRDLDVINRFYAFTREHLDVFHRLASALNITEDDWLRSTWDDMVLSFSGTQKPRSHDVGPYLDCPTQGKKGIAGWRENGFFEERETLFRTLQNLKPSIAP